MNDDPEQEKEYPTLDREGGATLDALFKAHDWPKGLPMSPELCVEHINPLISAHRGVESAKKTLSSVTDAFHNAVEKEMKEQGIPWAHHLVIKYARGLIGSIAQNKPLAYLDHLRVASHTIRKIETAGEYVLIMIAECYRYGSSNSPLIGVRHKMYLGKTSGEPLCMFNNDENEKVCMTIPLTQYLHCGLPLSPGTYLTDHDIQLGPLQINRAFLDSPWFGIWSSMLGTPPWGSTEIDQTSIHVGSIQEIVDVVTKNQVPSQIITPGMIKNWLFELDQEQYAAARIG